MDVIRGRRTTPTTPHKEGIGDGRPQLAVVEALHLTTPLDPYLSITALAAYSGLSRRKLRELLKDPVRPLPHYRIGAKILVKRGEYDGWALHYRRVGNPDVEQIVSEVLAGLK